MSNEEILWKLQVETQRARETHAQLAYSLGVYFGYPHCCRMEFCNDILLDRNPEDKNIDGSGFIPCRKHFVEIKLGIIKLEDLIKNRVCPIPFKNVS